MKDMRGLTIESSYKHLIDAKGGLPKPKRPKAIGVKYQEFHMVTEPTNKAHIPPKKNSTNLRPLVIRPRTTNLCCLSSYFSIFS